MGVIVYGLKSCDTCRKALKWLDAEGIEARLHDLRADGIDDTQLRAWADELGWEQLLNRRSTTFRQLDDDEKQVETGDQAVALMASHPTLIKRPVFDLGDRRLVGFGEAIKEELSALKA